MGQGVWFYIRLEKMWPAWLLPRPGTRRPMEAWWSLGCFDKAKLKTVRSLIKRAGVRNPTSSTRFYPIYAILRARAREDHKNDRCAWQNLAKARGAIPRGPKVGGISGPGQRYQPEKISDLNEFRLGGKKE